MKNLLCLFTLFTLGAAFAEGERETGKDKYYIAIHSWQDGANTPSQSHSFATFFHEGSEGTLAEKVEISWLPDKKNLSLDSKGKLQTLPKLRVVPGHNYTYAETLKMAPYAVKTAGPYEVTKEVWEAAQKQKKSLDSGKMDYKMLDGLTRNDGVFNCIHAITDIIGPKLTGWARGKEVNDLVLEQLKKEKKLKNEKVDVNAKERFFPSNDREPRTEVPNPPPRGSH